MTAGAVGKQIELLLLNPVLHLPAGTIDLVIESLRRAAQVGHDVAGIGPLHGVLAFDNDAPGTVPGGGRIGELIEQPLLRPRGLKATTRLVQHRLRQLI